MTRVAICGRTTLFREALAAFVTSQGHELVCCVGTLDQAIEAVARSDPDVLLLDASVAERRSLVALRTGREHGDARRVFLLAGSDDDSWAAQVVADGLVDGVFDQAVALSSLERAVDGVEAAAVSTARRTVVPPRQHRDPCLTAREHEVIHLLSAGMSTDAMAETLGVGPSTVHSHVRSILWKLGAHSRLQAVSIYLGEGSRHRRPRR